MTLPSLLLGLSAALLPITTARPSASTSNNDWTVETVYKRDITPESFAVVGSSGVSAQMMFNPGVGDKVYIIDKTENNALTVTSSAGVTHPAWAVSYDTTANTVRAMDVESNAFCAGGMVLGNGTWAVFGGNQPITTAGVATTGQGAYDDTDGGAAIRLLDPCGDDSCEYIQGTQTTVRTDTAANLDGYLQMTSNRWYPTVEGLEDGSLIIIGGDNNGGYVNTVLQDNPTYEFFPRKGDGKAITLEFLSDNLPVNLYPLTWLLPSGNLFMQANLSTIIYDYKTLTTTNLPDMPYAVRVYPANAATTMLPLTPANNYTVTLVFCGGSSPPDGEWGSDGGIKYNITAVAADDTCVRISPEDASPQYEDDDSLPTGRSMGQFVYLPDGTLWMGNGVHMGTAGYGSEGWGQGESYGAEPVYQPGIYDPNAALGSRWNWNLAVSNQERMYHSSVVLLKDGSLLISGSNPNADVSNTTWATSYSVERWYPKWYNEERPGNQGFPDTLSYGGNYWNLTLNTTDETIVQSAKVNIIRGGFSTHAVQWGQRFLELETSYLIDNSTNTTTLFVSQMPPNAALFSPGPALMFLVLDGVPSNGLYIMIGSGQIETQTIETAVTLPTASTVVAPTTTTSAAATSTQVNATSGALTSVSLPAGISALIGLVSLALALI